MCNHSIDFLPRRARFKAELPDLHAIWSGQKGGDIVELVSSARSDQALLEQLEKSFREKASRHMLYQEGFYEWILGARNWAMAVQDTYRLFVGDKLDKRALKRFNTKRCLARSRQYFRQNGVPAPFASAASAACAVHLGGIPAKQFGLPEDVHFTDLGHEANLRHLNRIHDQVGRDCRDYLAWSRSFRAEVSNRVVGAPQEGPEGAYDSVLRAVTEGFVKEEEEYFGTS